MTAINSRVVLRKKTTAEIAADVQKQCGIGDDVRTAVERYVPQWSGRFVYHVCFLSTGYEGHVALAASQGFEQCHA